ncbi:MAG: hypothetical protein COX40_02830 [Candidatus Omnitrophica bacterium CG23_combo_of_CG06-09_8_20_14_all_40_11]|nr:MAG: hypothetical protein COX40_02830 [Candidatus Omnitrophica bacterium CG23_combo_of_CG06-09_8_20_14_all_40_11]
MKLTNFIITKDKIVNITIIIIASIIVICIYKSQTNNIQTLKIQKEVEIKKNELLDNIRQSEKVISSYQNLISKRDMSLILATVSNIADESGATIISIKPAAEEQSPVYIRYLFNLTVSVNNYHAIGTFISNLENHPDGYFVDQLNLKFAEGSKESDQVERLIADLRLSIILLR